VTVRAWLFRSGLRPWSTKGGTVPEGVWKRRWERLREAGITFEQAKIVYRVLDETRAFGYQWTADTAYKDLEEAYGEVKVGSSAE
jgi:hypothetical protein